MKTMEAASTTIEDGPRAVQLNFAARPLTPYHGDRDEFQAQNITRREDGLPANHCNGQFRADGR